MKNLRGKKPNNVLGRNLTNELTEGPWEAANSAVEICTHATMAEMRVLRGLFVEVLTSCCLGFAGSEGANKTLLPT